MNFSNKFISVIVILMYFTTRLSTLNLIVPFYNEIVQTINSNEEIDSLIQKPIKTYLDHSKDVIK